MTSDNHGPHYNINLGNACTYIFCETPCKERTTGQCTHVVHPANGMQQGTDCLNWCATLISLRENKNADSVGTRRPEIRCHLFVFLS